MKKIVALFCVLSAVALADLEFSPGGATPGKWSYDGVNTFSFTQIIEIDSVLGGQSDSLTNQLVYLPSMTISSYSNPVPGFLMGTLTGGGLVEIKTTGGDLLVSGVLAGGSIGTMNATAALYSEITTDILITYVNNSISSGYLAGLSSGMYFNLALSLQSPNTNFDTMIVNNLQGSNGFSGSLTAMIPEPATMILLGLGALLTRKF